MLPNNKPYFWRVFFGQLPRHTKLCFPSSPATKFVVWLTLVGACPPFRRPPKGLGHFLFLAGIVWQAGSHICSSSSSSRIDISFYNIQQALQNENDKSETAAASVFHVIVTLEGLFSWKAPATKTQAKIKTTKAKMNLLPFLLAAAVNSICCSCFLWTRLLCLLSNWV